MSLRGITEDWRPDQSREGTVYIGSEASSWLLHLFTNETHAVAWMAGDQGRHIWVADVKVLYEMEYVPPGEARLRPKGDGS